MKTKYTKAILEPIIQKALSWNDVCRALNVTWNSGTVKKHLQRCTNYHGIDYSHFLGKRKNILWRTTAKQGLKLNSNYNRSTIRKIVIEDKLLPYICSICEQPPIWKDKPLTLTLDHINGNPKDHGIENLRFVCPNCDTQLPTYSGKNAKGVRKTFSKLRKRKRVNMFPT